MATPHERRVARSGLTHVELLLSTIVCGLFAATMLPESVGTSGDVRRSSLEEDVESLRTAVEMYRYEHADTWPAAGTTDAGAFEAALLAPSETQCGTCGPYVVECLPANPFNGLCTVKVVDVPLLPAPDDTTGWTYSSVSGAIAANTTGRDATGRRIADR